MARRRPAEPPPPPPKPQPVHWYHFVMVALALPGMFWLKFGTIDGFAIGFTAFILMLLGGVAYSDVAREIDEGTAPPPQPKIARSPFDILGIVWLLAVPTAPLASWIIMEMWTIDGSNWQQVLGTRAVLCVAIPVTCVLPLLRYVRGPKARAALLVLFVGTAFPVAAGWASMIDVFRGPVWERVEITTLERIHSNRYGPTQIVVATLADGRELKSNSTVVQLKEGPARLLLLKATERILKTEAAAGSQ